MLYVVLLVLFAVGTLAWIIGRSRTLVTCMGIKARIFPNQLCGLDEIIEAHLRVEEAWVRSQGIVGLVKRWRNKVPLVRLVQCASMYGLATDDEVTYALDRSIALSAASLAAAVWYPLRFWRHEKAETALMKAIRLYSELASHTHSLLAEDDAPTCAQRLAAIL